MYAQFVKGLNKKNFILAMGGVFVFIFFFEWLLHGYLLKDQYQAMANLWRSPEDMKSKCLWFILGYLLIAKYFTFIFARGCETSGAGEGARYGFLMGLIWAGGAFIWYGVMPIPQFLLWSWVVGGLVESILAGIIAGLIYKKKG
jgi:hypothetical protein